MWRLKNFNGKRLPAPENTYLFHPLGQGESEGRAPDRSGRNPRRTQPQLDDEGQMVALPAIERTLAACLDGIRRAQSQRGDKRRLAANRVVLYVWPVADVPSERFSVIAQNAARLTVGAGLEEINAHHSAEGPKGRRAQGSCAAILLPRGCRCGHQQDHTPPPNRCSPSTRTPRRSRVRGHAERCTRTS